jgi:deoxyribonuclease-4
MLGSLQDTLRMSQEIEGVLPCLDFAHLHARPGDGSMNTYDEWQQVLEAYVSSLGAQSLQSLHIHLSGIDYGPKGEKEHLPIQEADLNISDLFRALQATGAAGRMLCESPAMEDDAILLRQKWQEVAGG